MNASKSRGTKRKRDADNEEEDISIKLKTKLHHEAKEVKKAGKRVKAFEIQKLVKKLKDARAKEDDKAIKEMEEQLAYLKQLDHDHISILSLRNKFKKDKFLIRNPACEAAISSELPLPAQIETEKGKAASVVESRFLSSKTLSKEVDRVLQGFRALLGGAGSGAAAAGESSGSDEEESEDKEGEKWTGFGGADEEARAPSTTARKGAQRKASKRPEVDEDEGASDDSDADLQYSSTFEDEQGDADGWESGSIHEDEDGDSEPEVASDQDSDSDVEASDVSTSSASPKKPKKPSKDKGKKVKKPSARGAQASNPPTAGSTFLPSLSVGFVRGDSDSEWSDAEGNAADLPQRKNRRGQRARKAIWEKKFGRNANHVKKQQEKDVQDATAKAYAKGGKGRGRGVEPSTSDHTMGKGRGAVPDANPRSGVPSQGTPSGDDERRQRIADMNNKPLHPSWEAKKRMKDKQSAVILPAQGTRITFN